MSAQHKDGREIGREIFKSRFGPKTSIREYKLRIRATVNVGISEKPDQGGMYTKRGRLERRSESITEGLHREERLCGYAREFREEKIPGTNYSARRESRRTSRSSVDRRSAALR